MNPGQQDPHATYGGLDQSQLSNIAREFIARFSGKSDPQAQQYAQLDPTNVSPQQVAEMHQYAAQQHPGVLREVMEHPVITGVIAAFAAHELKKHFG
jgi:hypothetical protein